MTSVLVIWLLVALLLTAILYSGRKTCLPPFQVFLACLAWPWVGIREILNSNRRRY